VGGTGGAMHGAPAAANGAHLVHGVLQRWAARQRQRHGALQLVPRQLGQRGAQLVPFPRRQRRAGGGSRLAQLAHRRLQLLKLLWWRRRPGGQEPGRT
jgi:hypothetical protein